MKVSIIVPVWNGYAYLPACLDALLAQDCADFEVIAVDNASTDGSADLVADSYSQVRLIRNRRNMGFAGGCNVGLQAAQGDVLVLLNQDTIARPGWLRSLVRALQEPRTGIVGCKILYPDGITIQHAGGWIQWPLGLSYHYGQGEQDIGQWDVPRAVEYVTGAAMAFRRDVLDRVGSLDQDFRPGYYEDTDFCFRAREAGYEIWYSPDAILVHEETTSLTDPMAISRAYQRGRMRFVLKHMPPQRFLAEFVPAEKDYQLLAIQGPEGDSLRIVYLETIPAAVRLLNHHWQADETTIDEVVTAFQLLYHSPPPVQPLSFAPPLQEFEFQSTVPVIGPLIARFRSFWYGVGARWAVRYLIQQQEAINRRQEAINRQQAMVLHSLERRLRTENAFLAQEIARLILQSDPDEGQSRLPERKGQEHE